MKFDIIIFSILFLSRFVAFSTLTPASIASTSSFSTIPLLVMATPLI